MKAKRATLLMAILAFSISLNYKDHAVSNNIEEAKINFSRNISNALAVSEGNSIDPKAIFGYSISDYKSRFSKYIDVISMNVEDKSEIELPSFDASYIPPKFYDVMFSRQKNFLASLDSSDKAKYENFRRKDYSIDRYATLIESKFENLSIHLKYPHSMKPLNPISPITPLSPEYKTSILQTAAIDTSGIVTILTSAGLSEVAISAFTASISAMTTALSTSWIPIVGKTLAVAIVAGALIALTVVIVENWDAIQTSLKKITNWFVEQFVSFGSYITSFFSDVLSKGKASKKVGEDNFDGDIVSWYAGDMARAISISIENEEDKTKVSILRNVSKKYHKDQGLYFMSFWYTTKVVNEKYVGDHHLYDKGVSTHTFTYGVANRMMCQTMTKIVEDPINYAPMFHSYLETESKSMNGWDHLHLFKRDKVTNEFKRYTENPEQKVHSFFGPMYLRKAPGVNETEKYPS